MTWRRMDQVGADPVSATARRQNSLKGAVAHRPITTELARALLALAACVALSFLTPFLAAVVAR